MKRLVAVVLALAMLCVASAVADPFTFSNGVQWSMTKEQVKALEGEPTDTAEADKLSGLVYLNCRVSKYTAAKIYYFGNDSLFTVVYGLEESAFDQTMQYLKGAVSSLYGEPTAITGSDVLAVLNSIASTGGDTYGDGYMWLANGDTKIYLFSMEEGYEYLMYMDASFDPSQIGKYDTTGL